MNPEDPALPSYAWLKKVNNALFGDSDETITATGGTGLFYEIRPVQLVAAWRADEGGVYKGKAVFITQNGRLQRDKIIDVYAPVSNMVKEENPYESTFYVVWRGRWEALPAPQGIKPYIAGDSISVGIYDSDLGGIPIVNMGVTKAQIAGQNRQETKTLYFSPIWFKWIASSLDISGKQEIAIKATTVEVVTGIKTSTVTVPTKINLGGVEYDSSVQIKQLDGVTTEKILVLAGADE